MVFAVNAKGKLRIMALVSALCSCLAACGWSDGGIPSLPLGVSGQKIVDPTRNLVYIASANGTFCGGVLLSASTLATAEHCFDGQHDSMTATTLHQTEVQIEHVEARGSVDLTSYSPSVQDIATARLSEGFSVTAPLARLMRPVLQKEVIQAWIPFRNQYGLIEISVLLCPVLGQVDGLIELDCQIQPGASGSPIFAEDQRHLKLAGILVARGQGGNKGIAVAAHAHLITELIRQ